MRIQVQLFARAVELAGTRCIELELPKGADLADVAGGMSSAYPRLASLVAVSRWACGDQFVSEKFEPADGQTLVLIPPVSGG